jgi:transposase
MDDINTDAKASFRRIEVLTGPGRRRRWSVSEKAQIVAETLAPGASVSDVARRWQVSAQQVFGWRREARAGFLALPMAEPSFVPIVPGVTDAAAASGDMRDAAARTERAGKGAAGSSIAIKLAGAVVRVTPGTDTALLADVLRAIRASAA